MLDFWPVLSGFILLFYISSVCSDGPTGLQNPSNTAHKSPLSRREVSGLFPFPRVGRTGGEVIPSDEQWEPKSSMMSSVSKRQGLIPFPRIGKRQRGLIAFPRIGRAGDEENSIDYSHSRLQASSPLRDLTPEEFSALLEQSLGERGELRGGGLTRMTPNKRSSGQGGGGGMWFGPRLGRKRRSSSRDDPMTMYNRFQQMDVSSDGLVLPWSSEGDDSTCDLLKRHQNAKSIIRNQISQEQQRTIAEEDLKGKDASEYEYLESTSDDDEPDSLGEDISNRESKRQRRQSEVTVTKKETARVLKERKHAVKDWKVPEKLAGVAGKIKGIYRPQQ